MLYSLDSGLLQSMAKLLEFREIIELGAVQQSPSPGEDAGNGVGGSLFAFLVLAIVAGDSSMGSLSLDSAIRSVKH